MVIPKPLIVAAGETTTKLDSYSREQFMYRVSAINDFRVGTD